MSVSLVLLQIEVVEDNPLLKSLEYTGPLNKQVPEENPQFHNFPKESLNLKLRRGLREPTKITVITLDEKAIAEEMRAFESSQIESNNLKDIPTKTESKNSDKYMKKQEKKNKLTATAQETAIGETIPKQVLSKRAKKVLKKAAAKEKTREMKQDSKQNDLSKTLDAKEKVTDPAITGKLAQDIKGIVKENASVLVEKGLLVEGTEDKEQCIPMKKDQYVDIDKKHLDCPVDEPLGSKASNFADVNIRDSISKGVSPNESSTDLSLGKFTKTKKRSLSDRPPDANTKTVVAIPKHESSADDTTDIKVSMKEKSNENMTNSISGKDETAENILTDNDNSVSAYSAKESSPKPSGSKEGTPASFKESHHFESGNSLVEVTKGILHFYQEDSKTSLDGAERRSEMLCILAVPTSMGVHDLFQFTASCYPSIQHLRIIRDSNPNQYMVLLKFRTQEDADFFYTHFNGQTFNSIQPDICRLVYVSRVETTDESDGGLPIPGHTELPTCPVCLERMDESVDGILTILCNHRFHGECLAKWGDTGCPVCRYCQVPDEVPEQRCVTCGSTDSLWICLICGHVGCGRYTGGHAHNHFADTSHLFALQVGNNRVWDYVRDNYVHRLLQSEGDGKVVSLEREHDALACKELTVDGEEKLTAMQVEYTYMLTSQMESQREYFERKLSETALETSKAMEEAIKEGNLIRKELEKTKEALEKVAREKKTMENKLHVVNGKIEKLSKDLKSEKILAKGVLQNNLALARDIQELENSRREDLVKLEKLQLEAGDYLRHITSADMVRKNPEIEGGAVSLPSPPIQKKKGRKGRRS